ncbi:MAG: hypothetical protein NTX36_07745, partial [Proteobacteria bacterium]|nr:hypothetical protein [Pseudomonadota bacterium]
MAVVEISVKAFLVDHIRTMTSYFDISLIVNTPDKNFLKPFGLDVTVIPVPIERKISPLMDLRVILRL